MIRDLDQDDAETNPAHRVTWFAPDRPVEGQTIYVRQVEAEVAAASELDRATSAQV